MSDALTAAVASNPQRFAELAPRLKDDVDPAYQYGLLWRLKNALTARAVFPWEPVLDLARAAAARPRVLPSEEERRKHRPDEGRARRAVVDLLLEGSQERAGEIPFSLREAAWAALVPITDDPDPNAGDDAERKDEKARVGL